MRSVEPGVAQRRIREALRQPGCVVNYSDHVRDRMKQRRVLAPQVHRVLSAGAVVEFQGPGRFQDGLRFLLRGRDENGRALGVVVDIYVRAVRIDIVTVEISR